MEDALKKLRILNLGPRCGSPGRAAGQLTVALGLADEVVERLLENGVDMLDNVLLLLRGIGGNDSVVKFFEIRLVFYHK